MTFPALVALLLAAVSPARAVAAPLVPHGGEILINDAASPIGFVQPAGGPQGGAAALVTVLADGEFVVAWNVPAVGGGTAIYTRRVRADGTPAEGAAAPLHPGAAAAQAAMALAATPDGGWLIAWQEEPNAAASTVFVQRVSPAGDLGSPIGVSEPLGPQTETRRVQIGRVEMAAGPDGDFAVAWTAIVALDPSAISSRIQVRRFTASGTPAGPSQLVAAASFGPGGGSSPDVGGVALEPDGSLLVVYEQDQADASGDDVILLQRCDAAGQPVGEAAVLFPPRRCCRHQLSAAVSPAPDGSFTVAWSGIDPFRLGPLAPQASILGGRFAGDGSPLGPVYQMSKFRFGQAAVPALATRPGGELVLVWMDASGRDGDGDGIFGRSFAPNGVPRTPDYRVNLTTAGNQLLPVVAAGARTGLVVWTDDAHRVLARLLAR
jgi:hypothetical protein